MVTVTVESYNHEKYIDSFIDSLMAQTFSDVELIMCDDCSSDNTWDRIQKRKEELESKFKKVILIRHDKNMGVTVTLNELIGLSHGEWIKDMASDDMLTIDALEKIERFFLENPDVDIICANGYFVYENDVFPPALEKIEPVYNEIRDFSADGLFERLYSSNYVLAPGAAIRKRVYDRIGLYDESLKIEDWDFWLKAARNGIRFYFSMDVVCYYRKSSASMSSIEKNDGLEDRRQVMHDAEMAIIEKYKDCVSLNLYANTKLEFIDSYYYFSKQNGLRQSLKKARSELNSLLISNWKSLGIRRTLRYIKNFLKREIYGAG